MQTREPNDEPQILPSQADPALYLPPKETAAMVPARIPVAHDGRAGVAADRATGRLVDLPGEIQWEVLALGDFVTRRIEPAFTDSPAHGGLPDPSVIAQGVNGVVERERRRVQIGLKLSPADARLLDEAACCVGVTRTTLARMLVVTGAREIAARAPGATDSRS